MKIKTEQTTFTIEADASELKASQPLSSLFTNILRGAMGGTAVSMETEEEEEEDE